jgi:GTP-binding protein
MERAMTSRRKNIRNIAIIAHVDHGKTTLVDAMLDQAGGMGSHQKLAERAMDKMDQERERGITIMAKNTGVQYGDIRINIVDTPGHADFGGEVERTLHMVDGVLLLVDAAEGPLPQTRFVLEKALSLHLVPLVCINKCDRADARADEVLQAIYDLFIDLGADEEQLGFPVLYAVARDGWAVRGHSMGSIPEEALHPKVLEASSDRNLIPLLDTITEFVPGPPVASDTEMTFQVNAIDYDEYVGRLAIGRVQSGSLSRNQDIVRLGPDGIREPAKAVQISVFQGLQRKDIEFVEAGDLICLAGVANIVPGDTVVHKGSEVEPLPRFKVEEPTLTMVFSVNDSPFSGLEGKYVTSRQIRDRLYRETRGNVSLRVSETDTPDKFLVAGRGELSLAVLIETMRREGYEFCVSRPEVIVKEIDGVSMEPLEGVVTDLPETAVGAVTEVLGKRGGQMVNMGSVSSGRVRVEYEIPTRGLIGFRSLFLTLTRGEGLMSTFFSKWVNYLGPVAARKSGAMVATAKGRTTAYALFSLQARGTLFIPEAIQVYEGMIIGEHARENDIDVNAVKEKQLNNIRAAGKDENLILSPARIFSLEESMEFIDMDELMEVTPESLRLRKRILQANMRPRKKKKKLEEEA